MNLNVKAFALTCGLLWGLAVFFLTWWIMAFDGPSGDPRQGKREGDPEEGRARAPPQRPGDFLIGRIHRLESIPDRDHV